MKNILIFLFGFFALDVANAQWVPQNSGTTYADLQSVYFVNADTGYAVGHNINSVSLILKTTDGGIVWTLQYLGPHSMKSVFFATDDTGYVVGSSFNWVGNIRKTTNGGTDWTAANCGWDQLYSVYFTDANTGYAVGGSSSSGGNGVIFKTIDGGTTWMEQPSGTPSDCILYSVFFINKDTGFAVGGERYCWGLILKTTNGGTEWTTIQESNTDAFTSVYFTDANTGYVVGGWRQLLKTIDGGTNWTACYEPFVYFKSVYFTDANTGYVVGEEGVIIKTTDGGTNWMEQPSGTGLNLNSVYFTDTNTGYVVGDSGTILKTTNGGGYPVGSNNQPSISNSLKIYPNPSSDKIILETSAGGILSILNLNGQELLKQTITKPSTIIDISCLPFGVYFIRFRNENTVQMEKIIKQ